MRHHKVIEISRSAFFLDPKDATIGSLLFISELLRVDVFSGKKFGEEETKEWSRRELLSRKGVIEG